MVGDEATALRNAAMSQGSKQILTLDLAKVEAIDGSGLGLLVCLQGWTRTLGIELKLMNQMKQVQELLERTNLDSVFDICSSEDVASLLGHINFRNNTNSLRFVPTPATTALGPCQTAFCNKPLADNPTVGSITGEKLREEPFSVELSREDILFS